MATERPPDGAVTIRLRRVHLWAVAGLLIGIAAGVLIGRETVDQRPVLYSVQEGGSGGGADAGPAADQSDAAPIKVTTAGRPAFGPRDAKVTVVEFVDFECPFCGRFARDTLPRLRREYGDRVRYVSRHFPLASHPHARGAAVAAECAHAQGRYWQFHRVLFSDQKSLDARGLARHAREAGLDEGRFRSCTKSAAARRRVDKDEADGRGYGVSATPTFFVNGRPLNGALPFAAFKQRIDAALKR